MAATTKKTTKKPIKSTAKKPAPAAKKKVPAKATPKKVPAKVARPAAQTVAVPAPSSKKSSSLRIGAIVLALVLLVGGALYWAKCQYKKGPNYALTELQEAIVNQDVEGVQKRVDMSTLATSIIRQVFVPQVEEATANGLGALGNKFANSLADLVVPTLSSNLSREALNAVAAGDPQGADSLIFQRLWRSLAGTEPNSLELVGVENAQSEGDLASADVRFVRKDYKEEFVLAVQMQKVDKVGWQVVDINNFQQVLGALQEYRAAVVAAQNEKIRTQLAAALKVVNTALSKSLNVDEAAGELPTHVLLQAAFENTSGQAVTGFSAAVVVTAKGTVAKTMEVKEDELLPAGEVIEKSWPYGINPFSGTEKMLYDTNPDDIQTNIEITSIKFADGTTLSLIKE